MSKNEYTLIVDLRVDDEVIQATLDSPTTTADDLERLEAMVADDMGTASPWIKIIRKAKAALVMQKGV